MIYCFVSFQFISQSVRMDVPNNSIEPDIFENESKRAFDEGEISKERVLKSTKLKCSICKIGDLRPDGKQTQMIVYG